MQPIAMRSLEQKPLQASSNTTPRFTTELGDIAQAQFSRQLSNTCAGYHVQRAVPAAAGVEKEMIKLMESKCRVIAQAHYPTGHHLSPLLSYMMTNQLVRTTHEENFTIRWGQEDIQR